MISVGTLEVFELDLSHEPDCEEDQSGHACKHSVTHRIIACDDTILVCHIAAEQCRLLTVDPMWACSHCSSNCIRVVPV